MDDHSLDRVKQVFEQWSLYDLIIHHNYMRHTELVTCLNKFVKQTEIRREVIDLGCGDAWMAKHVFQDMVLESYLGVDLSDTALQEAADQLTDWKSEKQFRQGDIAEVLAEAPANSANTALASYSLHHFYDDQKLILLDQIHRILEKDGQFLWIDLARIAPQTRDQYVDEITSHICHTWKALSDSQNEQAVQHVLESDFPATEAWMLEHTARVGLQLDRCLFRDEYFGAWVFVKHDG